MKHRLTTGIALALVAAAALLAAGCDTTAERELARAEAALDDAARANASEFASDDYNAAEAAFAEAQSLAANNHVQEARSMAIKAKILAEDAKHKAEERQRILESEMERIGR